MLALRFASSISVFAIMLCAARCEAQQGKESTPTADKFAMVYGAKIHYVETGTGAPLILVHGLADDATIWDSVIPALSARFRVIALDQIGFGHSDKPLLNYRVSTFVDFLDGFLTELKIEHVSLIGNAAGYAALAKTMDPRAVSALRLASREDIRYLGPLTFHDKRFYQDVDLAFKQRVTAGDGYTVGRLLDSMIRGDDTLDNRLNVINRPTLILWGRDDKLIPLTFGERFHQEITNSRLQIIDNCGHMPQVECPDQFVTAVLQFFNDAR